MIYIVWSFKVRPQSLAEFKHHYGAEGSWVRLYLQAKGYLGTVLLCDSSQENCFLLWDRWDSLPSYEKFRVEHDDDFNKLDRECEAFTLEEKRIGVFEEVS